LPRITWGGGAATKRKIKDILSPRRQEYENIFPQEEISSFILCAIAPLREEK